MPALNRLARLLADNRAHPARQFEVRPLAAADEVEILLYDVIAADALEAEWFGGVNAETFVRELRTVTAATIHLRVNSPGGSVFAARAMEQALREHPARVVAHVDGLAASAASFVIMAADEIVMAKGAMIMIHKAWTFVAGNERELAAQAAVLKKIDGTLAETYADRSDQPLDTILGWMDDETWFTAAEAVELGLADRLADAEPAAPAAAWNLNAYLRPPAPGPAQAPAPAAAPPAVATEGHRARQRQRLERAARAAP